MAEIIIPWCARKKSDEMYNSSMNYLTIILNESFVDDNYSLSTSLQLPELPKLKYSQQTLNIDKLNISLFITENSKKFFYNIIPSCLFDKHTEQ